MNTRGRLLINFINFSKGWLPKDERLAVVEADTKHSP